MAETAGGRKRDAYMRLLSRPTIWRSLDDLTTENTNVIEVKQNKYDKHTYPSADLLTNQTRTQTTCVAVANREAGELSEHPVLTSGTLTDGNQGE